MSQKSYVSVAKTLEFNWFGFQSLVSSIFVSSISDQIIMADGCKLFIYGVDQNLPNHELQVGVSVSLQIIQ